MPSEPSEQALQRAAVAVAIFDAGWAVPDLWLVEGDVSNAPESLRSVLGKALADFETVPADTRAVEAAVGLRLLLVYVLAPALIRGLPAGELSAEVLEHGLYIASYVPGVSPEETLRDATDTVRTWLESATVRSVVLAVAGELDRRRTFSGEAISQFIGELLPAVGT